MNHPSRRLTSLVRARNAACAAPGCTRPRRPPRPGPHHQASSPGTSPPDAPTPPHPPVTPP